MQLKDNDDIVLVFESSNSVVCKEESQDIQSSDSPQSYPILVSLSPVSRKDFRDLLLGRGTGKVEDLRQV